MMPSGHATRNVDPFEFAPEDLGVVHAVIARLRHVRGF